MALRTWGPRRRLADSSISTSLRAKWFALLGSDALEYDPDDDPHRDIVEHLLRVSQFGNDLRCVIPVTPSEPSVERALGPVL